MRLDGLKRFKALSDETRYNILGLLLSGERCVCEIYPNVDRTQSTVSIQLGKLLEMGILESRREGKKVFYRLKDPIIEELMNIASERKVR